VQQPASGLALAPLPLVQVQAFDANGNLITSPTTVTITLVAAPSLSSFATGSITSAAVNPATGIATFATLVVRAAGTYKLQATAGGKTVLSNAFSVLANPHPSGLWQ
jgi:hypothetical protein